MEACSLWRRLVQEPVCGLVVVTDVSVVLVVDISLPLLWMWGKGDALLKFAFVLGANARIKCVSISPVVESNQETSYQLTPELVLFTAE